MDPGLIEEITRLVDRGRLPENELWALVQQAKHNYRRYEMLDLVNLIDPKAGAQCQVRRAPDYEVIERESAPDLEITCTFLVYVKADPDKPEDVMDAAHSRETQVELRRLAAQGDYHVGWEGHEG